MPEPNDGACCSSMSADCCAAPVETKTSTQSTAEEIFGDFMRTVNAPGAVSLRTKELMAISLSVLSKCEPCIKIHINKARGMGIGEEEIDEAVWMAISFGGAPVRMFYESVMNKI
ncbi:MAG: carboxymuconolactone decarboxylase family protein [Armatimonadota bacterium]